MEFNKMEYKKLFNEKCSAEVAHELIEEACGNVKKQHMYISGPFLQAEDRNRNGRIYPLKLIEREVKLFNKLIENRETKYCTFYVATENLKNEKDSFEEIKKLL